MNLADQALEFFSEQSAEDVRWGKPYSISVSIHAVLLLLFFALVNLRQITPPPVRVLEINVMGQQDLALKGTGNDYARGPLPDKEMLAQPPKGKGKRGKAVGGNTPKVSYAVTKLENAQEYQMPKLTPAAPIFSGRGETRGGGGGVGREKVYLAHASAVKMYAGSRRARGGSGEGLVGVPNQPIDLKARRGLGTGGDGTGGDGNGAGNFLSGGEGSVNGGSILQRKGESILASYPTVTREQVVRHRAEQVEVPAPSDAFFSLSGPLRHRKIVSMKLPRYPRWAEESGVEAQISIRLTVEPKGLVKSDIMVEQTSGYPEFDNVALEAVRSIRFAPLPPKDVPHDEWGVATFNFKLKNSLKRGEL